MNSYLKTTVSKVKGLKSLEHFVLQRVQDFLRSAPIIPQKHRHIEYLRSFFHLHPHRIQVVSLKQLQSRSDVNLLHFLGVFLRKVMVRGQHSGRFMQNHLVGLFFIGSQIRHAPSGSNTECSSFWFFRHRTTFPGILFFRPKIYKLPLLNLSK